MLHLTTPRPRPGARAPRRGGRSRRARVALATAAATLLLTACSGAEAGTGDVDPAPTAPATNAGAPTEPAAPAPVTGVVSLTRADVASEVGLGLAPQPAAAAPDVDAFVTAVVALLDGHLAAVADGTPSPLLASSAALGGDATATELLATLANAGDLVASAAWDVEVSAAAAPEWATVAATTTSAGGVVTSLTLVFTPGEAGPTLVAVGEPAPPDEEGVA